MKPRRAGDAGAEHQYSCLLYPKNQECVRLARTPAWHQRRYHPALGESFIRELKVELPVGYRVYSACLDLYSSASRDAATYSSVVPRTYRASRRGLKGLIRVTVDPSRRDLRNGRGAGKGCGTRLRQVLKATDSHRPSLCLHPQGVISVCRLQPGGSMTSGRCSIQLLARS